ncbi:MAG: acyl dehydratase [Hahellaceae bacterium]|jgi:acyl dehydratase|nr:acyl dehydratase [Hahellaceae bacterium]
MADIQELNHAPSTLNLYLKAAFKRKPKISGQVLPQTRLSLKAIRARRSELSLYRRICGFEKTGTLPLTYPHILAFPLHMQLLVDPEFPFPLPGLVHIRNTIRQYRAIGNRETLHITCYLQGPRKAERGLEFDIVTQVTVNDLPVWESISTNLFRTATQQTAKKPGRASDTVPETQTEAWTLSDNLGMRYAKVSGDANPIHLHAGLARLFGFPRAIIHGMWSKAHALARLSDSLPTGSVQVEVSFKLPVMLPATVQFSHQRKGGRTQFWLRDEANVKPHLIGNVEKLPELTEPRFIL